MRKAGAGRPWCPPSNNEHVGDNGTTRPKLVRRPLVTGSISKAPTTLPVQLAGQYSHHPQVFGLAELTHSDSIARSREFVTFHELFGKTQNLDEAVNPGAA